MAVLLCVAATAAPVACAGVGGSASGAKQDTPGTGGSSGPGFGTGGSTGSRPDGGVSLPPETEVESSYEVPVATGRYIWIANPQSGRVAYVEGATLNVHTVEAGNAPTTIASIPGNGGDAVVVLNALSNDLTVLRVAADGALAKTTVSGIAGGANALTISPGGRWVMAWTDTRRISSSDPLQGHQEVTLVDLTRTTPVPTVLSVGFGPVAVAYAADESAAFAVTQDGVSVVTLAGASGPHVTGNVELTDDADTRDVSITPNGRLALVRRNGNPAIGIADLSTGTLGSIALSGAVTDLDVTADGSQAVAVVRDTSEVAILPLAAGIPSPAAVQHVSVTGETIGSASIAADGKTVLLYTNAEPSQRLVVLTLGTAPAYRVVKLHAPILAVFPTPDASSAVVFHSQQAPAATTPSPDGGVRSDGGAPPDAGVPSQVPTNAFSLVPLAAGLPAAIQETDVPPQAVAITPAGDRVLVSEGDEKKQVFGVYLGQFPSLRVQKIALASPPIAVGVLAGAAANQGYVAQKNPQGRITFVELASGQARTLTGFEIGASVVDWASVADGGTP